MSVDLDSTFGVLFIGMVVAAVLYGVACIQAFYYYMYQNDPWYIKFTVTAIMILDTVHQVLISHTVYTYCITGWGDPVQLGHIVWSEFSSVFEEKLNTLNSLTLCRSLMVEVIFEGITAFIVQCVLTMRIWRLSGGNIYLTGIPGLLATGGFVTIILNAVAGLQWYHLKDSADLGRTNKFTFAVTVLNAACDLIIAAILCVLLNTARTGFHRSEVMINKLTVFIVNTGLITSLCALGCLISLLVAGNTFIYIAFFFCLGRLYANTLLATFNARGAIRRAAEAGITSFSFSLGDFQKNDVSSQTQDITIAIDRSTEIYQPGNVQELEENSRLPYDGESAKMPC